MSAVERAAEVIAPIIANATACGYDPKGTCGTCRADSALIAQALANAGLLVTPDTVTLPRDDAWIMYESAVVPLDVDRRIRAALGWGDSDDA